MTPLGRSFSAVIGAVVSQHRCTAERGKPRELEPVTDLVPIDDLVVSSPLSGVDGRTRSSCGSQIRAEDDRSAVLVWLAPQ